MLRKIFIGGNWKCHNSLKASVELVENVYNKISFDKNKIELLVSPISLHLGTVRDKINPDIFVSSQNVSVTGQGAYTGEVAAEQLTDFGINWTLVGHSERRQYFGETNEIVAKKVGISLENDLNVVLCIGEVLEDREAGNTNEVLEAQLTPVIPVIGDNWQNIVIAYEPVWAIGTGLTATPEQAQETHNFIRNFVSEKVDGNVANNLRIIYGGSAKSANCEGLIVKEDIDGFLVGGASLKPDIAEVVSKVQATLN